MKKRLGVRRQIFSAFLPVLAAAALLSGCQRENPAAVTEVSEESQEESRETEQNSKAGTDVSVAETSSGDEKGEDLKHQKLWKIPDRFRRQTTADGWKISCWVRISITFLIP